MSSYYLTRSFRDVTGQSIMRYLRSRRLTIAAEQLANGHKDILALAYQSGYNSHEAFTRAFRSQLGQTPEKVRENGSLCGLQIVDAIPMEEKMIRLDHPRIIEQAPMNMVGLNRRYAQHNRSVIPGQWQEFISYIGSITNRVNCIAYGISHNSDDDGNMDYMCAMQVLQVKQIPKVLTALKIPRQHYAVFVHSDHVSKIRNTWHSIWTNWLPSSGFQLANGPDFERYGNSFNPETGAGEIEVWVPIKACNQHLKKVQNK